MIEQNEHIVWFRKRWIWGNIIMFLFALWSLFLYFVLGKFSGILTVISGYALFALIIGFSRIISPIIDVPTLGSNYSYIVAFFSFFFFFFL